MQNALTIRERIEKTLRGEPCDRIPWATRLDIWHAAATRSGTLPEPFVGMDLMGIHRHLGIGRQGYALAFLFRLHEVEVTVEFNGEVVQRERDPRMLFPVPRERVPTDRPGDTIVRFTTPVGRAQLAFRTTQASIQNAEMPYLVKHIIGDDDDFRVVRWILDRAELVPLQRGFEESERTIGDDGFTIPMVGRIPFQQIMLDYMGEELTIYTLADNKPGIDDLLAMLSEHARRALEIGLEVPAPVVEFSDNLEGTITSPALFKEYCIPFLQESADRAHAKGKLLASHMDGNLLPLVDLIAECGVDLVESFSPAPLTPLTFAQAWGAWQGEVLLWGVIPSPIFEPHVSDRDFEKWLEQMFRVLDGDQRIILGIGDQALGTTLTERIEKVSELLGYPRRA